MLPRRTEQFRSGRPRWCSSSASASLNGSNSIANVVQTRRLPNLILNDLVKLFVEMPSTTYLALPGECGAVLSERGSICSYEDRENYGVPHSTCETPSK